MSAMRQHQDLFRYGPESQAEPVAVGIKQVLLSSAEQMVQSKTWYQYGAEQTVLNNTQTQTSYILEGFFEISVEGRSQILGPGGSFILPIGSDYSIRCLDDGVLLTTQAPQGHNTNPRHTETRRSRQHARRSDLASATIRSKAFD
ncbi:MAG: hypothetical protein AAGL90_12150 [Pseudomonadota bacterium]